MHSELLLVIVVVAALAFDFTNGFHDTANVVAATIATRVLSPRLAIAMAAVLNFVGAFLSLKVAATIATGIVSSSLVTEHIAFAALLAAIAWNLITWALGLPSSSSHALIGAVFGAALAAAGSRGVHPSGLVHKVIVPALLSPMVAFGIAAVTVIVLYRVLGNRRPGAVRRGLRGGQIVAGGALALAHGTNDAQKTMGVISLALVAHGTLNPHHVQVPQWVVVSAAAAIALGTYAGGWRIIRTLGSRIIKLDIAQGFAAQATAALVILGSTHLGYPLSTTQVVSGGIVGAGAGRRLSAVRWGIAGNIAIAWVLTLPGAGLLGAGAWWVADLFGTGTAGPAVMSLVAVALTAALVASRRMMLRGQPISAAA